MKNKKGFTFIETLIVIGIIAILATTVVVAVNPAKRFEDARDKQREIHLQTILSAIERKTTIEAGWFDEENCDPLPQATSTEVVDGKEVELPLFKTIGTGEGKSNPEEYYDLFKCLVPKYMVNPLYDPSGGDETDTGYQIWQNPQTKYVTLRYIRLDPKDHNRILKRIVAGAEKYGILSIPTHVETTLVSSIGHTTAVSGGTVYDDGGDYVFEAGVIWAKLTDLNVDSCDATEVLNKLILDNVDMSTMLQTIDAAGTATEGGASFNFTSNLHSLKGGAVEYCVRAYARNEIGAGYGQVEAFATLDAKPYVETLAAENVTNDTAKLRGRVETMMEYPWVDEAYFCWWGPDPDTTETCETVKSNIKAYPTPLEISKTITGLTAGETYHFKACATAVDVEGERCGDTLQIEPKISAPFVETLVVKDEDKGSDWARVGGEVISYGGADITRRGFCYHEYEIPCKFDPDITCVDATEGALGPTDNGQFFATLTGLEPGNGYNVCAFAENTNNPGLSFGESKPFTTIKTAPVVTTVGTSNVKSSSASAIGRIDKEGGEVVTQYGICWLSYPRDPQTDSTTKDPKNSAYCTKNNSQIGKGDSFTHDIIVSTSGLWGNTKYNVRAYAINIKGTGWGNMVDFTTDPPTTPTITTTEPPTNITMTSAKLKGNITDHGGAKISGASGSFRICYSLSASNTDPKIGGQGVIGCPSLLLPSNLGEFTIGVTNLIPSTSYHYQAYVKNEAGLDSYGGAKSFETLVSEPPTFETIQVDDSGGNWAEIKGEIKTTGGYPDTKRGICYKTAESDATCIEDTEVGVGEFWVTTQSNLALNTTYYAFAFAYNNPEEKFYDETPIQFELKICTKYVDGENQPIDSGQDPFEQCTPTVSDGCRSDNCSGTGASCGILTGDGACPTCQTCEGVTSFTCVTRTNNTQDTTSPGTCSGTCQACQNGTCGVANAGTDPGNKCNATNCYTGNCKGGTAVCDWYTTGDGNCPACQYCEGATSGDCKNRSNYSSDTTSPNTCSGTCTGYCYSGACTSANTAFGTCYVNSNQTVAAGGDGMCSGGTCIAGTRYYLYITNTEYSGNLGGRNGADAKCNIDANKPVACTRDGWAFISVSTSPIDDEIRDFPTTKSVATGLPWYWRYGNTSLIAANYFYDLLDGSIVSDASDVGYSDTYWTGSTASGGLLTGYHCYNWQTNASGYYGQIGNPYWRDNTWLSWTNRYCGSSYTDILCACLGIE